MHGVHVKLSASNESQVTLGPLELSSSGRYRCEVSAEAPSFQTVSDHGDMVTVALPEEGPRIEGGKPRYQVGDKVRVNCSSGPSKPAAQLSWYINGHLADERDQVGPIVEVVSLDGLASSKLGLEFRVERRHFRRGDLKLKCLASIGTVYWNSNEESVKGERAHPPSSLDVMDNISHASNGHDDPYRQGPRVTELTHDKSKGLSSGAQRGTKSAQIRDQVATVLLVFTVLLTSR